MQAADIHLRHGRAYQRARRTTLALSVLFTLVVPVWHLRSLSVEGAGMAGGVPWATLGEWLRLPMSPPPIVGAPWTIAVFGIEFLDPLAGLGLFAARVIDLRIVLGLIPTVVLIAILGRFFCGWMCPYLPLLAASNAVRSLVAKLGARPLDLRLPRRLNFASLLIAILAAGILGTHLVPLLYPPSIVGRELFRAVFQGALGAGSALLLLFFAFDTLSVAIASSTSPSVLPVR